MNLKRLAPFAVLVLLQLGLCCGILINPKSCMACRNEKTGDSTCPTECNKCVGDQSSVDTCSSCSSTGIGCVDIVTWTNSTYQSGCGGCCNGAIQLNSTFYQTSCGECCPGHTSTTFGCTPVLGGNWIEKSKDGTGCNFGYKRTCVQPATCNYRSYNYFNYTQDTPISTTLCPQGGIDVTCLQAIPLIRPCQTCVAVTDTVTSTIPYPTSSTTTTTTAATTSSSVAPAISTTAPPVIVGKDINGTAITKEQNDNSVEIRGFPGRVEDILKPDKLYMFKATIAGMISSRVTRRRGIAVDAGDIVIISVSSYLGDKLLWLETDSAVTRTITSQLQLPIVNPTTSASSPPGQQGPPPASSSSNLGVFVGIGVGIPVVLICLAAGTVIVIKKTKRAKVAVVGDSTVPASSTKLEVRAAPDE
eukprot:Colp12_sorted_trinity150504_noHs@9449